MIATRQVNRRTYVRNELHPGKRIGYWTLLREATDSKHRGYIARCKCGTEKFVQMSNLCTGASSRCCVCSARGKRKHEQDEKVNGKTLLFKMKRGSSLWLVRCDCGWVGEQSITTVERSSHRGCTLTRSKGRDTNVNIRKLMDGTWVMLEKNRRG